MCASNPKGEKIFLNNVKTKLLEGCGAYATCHPFRINFLEATHSKDQERTGSLFLLKYTPFCSLMSMHTNGSLDELDDDQSFEANKTSLSSFH